MTPSDYEATLPVSDELARELTYYRWVKAWHYVDSKPSGVPDWVAERYEREVAEMTAKLKPLADGIRRWQDQMVADALRDP